MAALPQTRKKRITLATVEHIRALSPKRRRLSEHPLIPTNQSDVCTFGTKFASLDRIFRAETGIATQSGPHGPYVQITTPDHIQLVLKWQQERGSLVFLRDGLDCSVALDINILDGGVYTSIGLAEHHAKSSSDPRAIETLADALAEQVMSLALYKECDFLCAVPREKSRASPIAQ
jgi:hypothetical protein